MGRRKEDGSSIRFYLNRSQAVATNVYLLLYPKPWILRDLQQPTLIVDGIFRRLVSLDQQEIVYQGRTYGGGLDKIEPNELQRVVVGTFTELETSIPALSEWKSFVQSMAVTQQPLPFTS